MADIHARLARHGFDAVMDNLTADLSQLSPTARAARLHEIQVAKTAQAVLVEESQAFQFAYSGFALTALPQRQLKPDQPWEKAGYNVQLLIEPGRLPQPAGGYRQYGVPFGSMGRIILLYMQTEAVRNNSRDIALGRTMRQWLTRMGIYDSGKAYAMVRDQGSRIAACHLTFSWVSNKGMTWERDHIVTGGHVPFTDNTSTDDQLSLWTEHITLSDAFYHEVRNHAVSLWEPAIRQLQGHPLALDVYVWLSYRLHSLGKVTPVSWVALFDQFGGGYTRIRDFRKRFAEVITLVLAVYPDAKVETNTEGLILHPSPAPVGDRRNIRLTAPRS